MDTSETKGTDTPTREFYMPATYQFSNRPGRVQRLLTRLFRQRGAMDGQQRGAMDGQPRMTRSAIVRHGVRPKPR